MKAALLALFLGAASLTAQTPATSEMPLEELRDLARLKVQEMREELEKDLAEAVQVLSEVDPEAESARARVARRKIAPWASAFPERFLEVMRGAKSQYLRTHLAEVLLATGNQKLVSLMIPLLGSSDPGLVLVLVDLLGRLGNPEAAASIHGLLAQEQTTADLRGAAMMALARLKAPSAGALARKELQAEAPELRAIAVRALARSQSDPKADADLLIRVAKEDADPKVRAEALRALGAYPGNIDVLRLLHDTIVGEDAVRAEAALTALESVASKELSRNYLYDFVQRPGDILVRERAARLLAAKLGDARGARHLAKPWREAAEKRPREVQPLMELGNIYRRLGAYPDALEAYKRAMDRMDPSERSLARIALAKTYALMGRFEDARKELKTDFKSLKGFAEEPEFQEMKRDPKYRSLFRDPSGA